MSGRHRRADEEVDVRSVDAGVVERRARGRKRDVGQRLVLGGDAPLADPGPLADPLVRGLDDLGELLVRHDLLGDVHAEAGDPDPNALRGAEHD